MIKYNSKLGYKREISIGVVLIEMAQAYIKEVVRLIYSMYVKGKPGK